MPYARELRDIDSTELLAELNRRTAARGENKCDYCGHDASVPLQYPDGTETTATCPKPRRHRGLTDEFSNYSVPFEMPSGPVGLTIEDIADLVLVAGDADFTMDWDYPESYEQYFVELEGRLSVYWHLRISEDDGETWISGMYEGGWSFFSYPGSDPEESIPPVSTEGLMASFMSDALSHPLENDTTYTVEIRGVLVDSEVAGAPADIDSVVAYSNTISNTVTPEAAN